MPQPRQLVIQMDAPDSFKPETDSTLALGLEAAARGYDISYYTPPQLYAENGNIYATVRPIRFFDDVQRFYESGEEKTLNLEQADVILIRQNPPYNMEYLSGSWLLERLEHPLVLNNPTALRNHPEKIFPLEFPDYCPPTVITQDPAVIERFVQEHEQIVMKPLYGFAGADILQLNAARFAELRPTLSLQEPVVLQPFLPEVMTEEKRILLVNGRISAAYNRRPPEGDFRTNGALGGSAFPTELTPKQREIAEAVGAECQKQGLILVGLDVIGDWLIEINITCPTGIRTSQRLYDINPASEFWDAVETLRQG